MSPRQVYLCQEHGDFEVFVPVGEDVPITLRACPVEVTLEGGGTVFCHEMCAWVPSAPNFIGGPTTGAKNK